MSYSNGQYAYYLFVISLKHCVHGNSKILRLNFGVLYLTLTYVCIKLMSILLILNQHPKYVM